ncbi:OVARIAN TUMOR DOMAIN-containing deubiquitinating enzyme 3 [Nymphaea colorata]|uniref:OVARIAN TUMOR DOMAIN-containing deubiquitinating enzyme 3 n=1 Tax=Nymphaea colorata TaxID=210225 RepID=UPI00129E20D5|nr:OVARIAN TUMOR DOMAIN-containing deubiquitinating enzyme 3 [Nymphaea colorata]
MALPDNPLSSKKTILEQLREGTAKFELVSHPSSPLPVFSRPFAKISPPVFGGNAAKKQAPERGASPAMRKVESYFVEKITGDGRCMFRALVKGMAMNKGIVLSPREEREDADDLRMAVKEVLCDADNERHLYEEALIAITVEESLKRYCQRIEHSNFWGGESELLVLSKLCCQPVIVYIPEHEHTRGIWSSGFIPIAEYGTEFAKSSKKGKARKPVRLLYSGRNHYDLLT